MEFAVTEVSLSIVLTDPPKSVVHDDIPFMIDPRGKSIERVVTCKADLEIPDWIVHPKTSNMKFVYRKLECTYRESKKILTISRIKYEYFRMFTQEYLPVLLKILGTSAADETSAFVRLKAAGEIRLSVPWNPDVFADVVTNDVRVSSIMAMCEKTATIKNSRLFSIAVAQHIRITMAQPKANPGVVTLMASRVPDKKTLRDTMDTMRDVFDIYEQTYDALCEIYGTEPCDAVALYDEQDAEEGIKYLRKRAPDLFVNNYTRECPVLPIMISKEEYEINQRENKRSIEYFGHYYTAPDGYFVGLKKNTRLGNRDVYPCLVTCYLSDHMVRPGSETYNYYIDNVEKNKAKSSKTIPKSVIGFSRENYCRMKAASFASAMELALGVEIDSSDLPWCPQIAKQEMWDASDEDIMGVVRSSFGSESASAAKCYRYFEELLEVSIHVITMNNGEFCGFLPEHMGDYVWKPPYDRHIVIFEESKVTYGRTSCTYDVLALRAPKKYVFDADEPAVVSIVSQKAAQSISVNVAVRSDSLKAQLIDENGKCRRLVFDAAASLAQPGKEGSQGRSGLLSLAQGSQTVFTRPLGIPEIDPPVCFFDTHVTKLNHSKKQMGLATIDLSKRSNNYTKYFPNNWSFEEWMKL